MKRSSRHSRPATKLYDHVRELRMRLVVSLIALIVAGIAVYAFYEPLLTLLRSPLNAPLYYSSPAGSFAFVMKICFMGALAVTIPVIIYNLIMFVRPVFEDKLPLGRVYGTTALSAVLALTGAVFAFVFILPGTLHFFSGFQVSGLNALISADSYLGFVTNVIITFILVFQLPLLVAFIDSIHPLPPKKLLGMEKWVILGSLIISLLVPFAFDLMTCLMIALPIVVLYNLSIIIVFLQHAQVKHHARAVTKALYKTQPTHTNLSTLSLSELSFEGIPNEAFESHQQPVTAPVAPMQKTRQAGIDIRPLTSRPLVVVPRVKIPTAAQQAALSSRVRLISDIQRGPAANHALTLQ
jgi:sec-independent protein translocase protein TatC